MKVQHEGKTLDVVIVGSPNVNGGYRLSRNSLYPQIASDYERMFGVLKSLHCDVFLGADGDYYKMEQKSRAWRRTVQTSSLTGEAEEIGGRLEME